MKTFVMTVVAALALAAPAMADDLDPMCEAFGELAAVGFEARFEGLEYDEAVEAALEEIDDADLADAVESIFEAAYEMEISEDEDEAVDEITEFVAEIMLACEEGLAEE